jgi:UPF0755 protein
MERWAAWLRGRWVRILVVALAMVATIAAVLVADGSPETVFDDVPERQASGLSTASGLVIIEVSPGDSAGDIAEALVEEGAITSQRRFTTLVSLLGYDDSLTPGRYDIPIGLTTVEIVERIHAGLTSGVVVTIPEGLQLGEIADRFAEAGVTSRADFVVASVNPENWEGTFAAERPPGVSLEGYLFPSTYRFSALATPDEIVRAMLTRFDEQWTADSDRRRLLLEETGRTMHDVLTVASIVERETALDAERPIVASVFWNRVTFGMSLAADPTVQYALARRPGSISQFGYWKSNLTNADLEFDSPFNTYATVGLPPTPIASPGVAAIDAALQPADTTYLFFVAQGDGSGSHAFAETFEEHSANVERLLGFGPDDGAAEAAP